MLVRHFTMTLALACALSAALVANAGPTGGGPCEQRLLVLSAFPGEIDALLAGADVTATVEQDGRRFFVGSLEGHDVVLALTGIGLVNADQTARAALAAFACGEDQGIEAIVFSGVAGGHRSIGDVVVPERWTLDDGETWIAADPAMLDVARAIADDVSLARDVPAGDPACLGVDPRAVSTVRFEHQPAVFVGGDGKSVDPFGGRRFPCYPGGGDVFGCEPCGSPSGEVLDVVRVVSDTVPFADPAFFFGYFSSPPPAATEWDAEDMESAAVARVAAEAAIPFIAFRALSDGAGDPLGLPGFPFQFFAYRQIAADNAAAVARAFLAVWDA